ncbi:MAG: thioesterase family protein [Desulfobacterales bacterium]
MKHRTICRVIYGDTDRMGQAYYGNYFRWFEIGRTEFFRALGLAYKAIEERGFFLPVSECHAKYAAPALYDELIVIETAVDSSVRGGIKFDYRIFREDGQTLVAEGYTKHAFMDASGRVVRPPAFVRELIAR